VFTGGEEKSERTAAGDSGGDAVCSERHRLHCFFRREHKKVSGETYTQICWLEAAIGKQLDFYDFDSKSQLE